MWNPFTKKSKPTEESKVDGVSTNPISESKFVAAERERLGSWVEVWKTYRKDWIQLSWPGFWLIQTGLMDEMAELIERNKK